MRKNIIIGSIIFITTVTSSAQLELKGGYEYWRKINNHSPNFDQGGSIGAEILFESLTKPLDYGLGIEYKSKFTGGGKNTALADTNSNAYPVYLTAKYDLYKNIYAVSRAGWVVFDGSGVNDGFYGAMGIGKKIGKFSIEALYESMDMFSDERAGVASIKFGYRFGESSSVKKERNLENQRRIEEVARLRMKPIIERKKEETFYSVIVATDYQANIEETNILNTDILNKVASDLEGKVGVLKVKGYTDDSGSNEINIKLSQKRAEIIADQIDKKLKEAAIKKNKDLKIEVIPKGYGETSFRVDNLTIKNRKRNRRIELEFIESKN